MGLELDLSLIPKQIKEATNQNISEAIERCENMFTGHCIGNEWLGWFDYPDKKGYQVFQEIKNYSDSIKVYYDSIVCLGIGGSYLGTRAISSALGPYYFYYKKNDKKSLYPKNYKPIFYAGHHMAEIEMAELLHTLDEWHPLVVVISKSGTTTETSIAFRFIRQYMENRFEVKEANQRIVAITDPSSGALRKLANEKKFKTFEIPPDMGGRYSVLSAVGMLPLTLAGYSCYEILQGASLIFSEIKDSTQRRKPHPVIEYAAYRKSAYDLGFNLEIMACCDPRLYYFTEWWKQLFGESEGKKNQGLFPASVTYTTDLHSLGQYIQEGKRSFIETFLTFKKMTHASHLEVPASDTRDDGVAYLEGKTLSQVNHAALLATKLAHYDSGVSVAEISLDVLSPLNLGKWIAFFECSCAVSGYMLGVNPFDQPGVEAYKKNMFALLGKPGCEDDTKKIRTRIRDLFGE